MKKYTIILLATLFSFSVYAQRNKKYEKVKSMKIAYITDKLDLSVEEAESFWPIYNEYNDKVHKLRHVFGEKYKANFRNEESINSFTDKEAKAFLSEEIKREEKIIAERKIYFQKLDKVISPQKTLLLIKAEHEFNKKLIKDLRHREGKK